MKDGRYNPWEAMIRLCYYSCHHCNDGGWFRRNIIGAFWAIGFVVSLLPYALWMRKVRKKDHLYFLELF
jgi:hypothetical protein